MVCLPKYIHIPVLTGRQDEERNTDTNLNCKKSEDAVKGGDVSQEERKRGREDGD